MSYDNYKTARDMAWKILLECGNGLPSHTRLGTWYLVTSHQAARRRLTESRPQGTTPLNVRRTSLRRGCWRPPASCTSWEPSHRRPSSGLVDSRARPLSSVRPGYRSWSAATTTILARWNGRCSNNLHHISPVYLGGNTASSFSFDT